MKYFYSILFVCTVIVCFGAIIVEGDIISGALQKVSTQNTTQGSTGLAIGEKCPIVPKLLTLIVKILAQILCRITSKEGQFTPCIRVVDDTQVVPLPEQISIISAVLEKLQVDGVTTESWKIVVPIICYAIGGGFEHCGSDNVNAESSPSGTAAVALLDKYGLGDIRNFLGITNNTNSK